MEKITEFNNLKQIVHKIYCDKCGVELQISETVLTSYPPQFPYECPMCGKIYYYDRVYPWAEIVGDEVNSTQFSISLS